MYPHLMPNHLLPRALEIVANVERLQAQRHGSYALALRGGCWKYSADQLRRYVLTLCNRYRNASDREFELALENLLEGCATLPIARPEHSTAETFNMPGSHFSELMSVTPDGDFI